MDLKRENNEDLDVQFKEILCNIRERIPFINSNAYLFQCRIWLEKLSSPRVDKTLRNIYLEELYKQIQNNRLSPPFNEAPPPGSLKNLSKIASYKRSSISHQINNSIRGISIDQRKCIDFNLPMNAQEGLDVCIEPLKSDEDSLEVVMPIKFFKKSSEKEENKPMKDTKLGGGEPGDVYDDNRRKRLSADAADDSWSDITDVTDEEENTKGKVNASILEHHSEAENDKRENVELYDDNPDENALKHKLQTFTLASSKDTNFISEDWKKTIGALQLRLSEMIQQNNQLNVIIQNLEIKLEELNSKNQVRVMKGNKVFIWFIHFYNI
ncbi:hypothetical protein GWI33_020078 [Rhynchophorus ferrugineus]|uniref:DUF4485 domain-containing protein n=1 Tax=Rhynchophorus ferrugineus TaxID=354439 RepID=A0A834HQ33_RHYFE|nr:hypothetical protein GWI33_020078 [Rhynchophorus ferrugineus]